MANYPPILREIENVVPYQPSPGTERTFSPEDIMSIDSIRTHTKTDDIPNVTDDQIALYRRASLEQAELFTSLLLQKNTHITEKVKAPQSNRLRRRVKHVARYQFAHEDVYVQSRAGNFIEKVMIGRRTLYVPVQIDIMSGIGCCNPCRGGGIGPGSEWDSGTTIRYLAGFPSPDSIPAGVIQGCLKYIAWSINNPGDVLMTVRNTQKSNNATIIGTNNAAWASGAIELWRAYAREEF